MKKIFCIAIIACAFLSGCDQNEPMTETQIEKYLEKSYNTEFSMVEESDIENENSGYQPRNLYVFEDENGVKTTVEHRIEGGYVGDIHYYAEDYLLQELISMPEIYAPLENSPYGFRIENTIESSQYPDADFILTISSFDEIRPAVELACSVVADEKAFLYYYDTDGKFGAISSCKPAIVIEDEHGCLLCEKSFIIGTDNDEPQDIDVEKKVREAEFEYVQKVRADVNEHEKLPDDIMKKYGPEEIKNVCLNGKKLENLYFYYSADYESYYLWDNGRYESGCQIYYPELSGILEKAGYDIEFESESITYSNSKRTVTIAREKDGDEKTIFTVTVNGEEYIPQGTLSNISTMIHITESDFRKMFGITVNVDTLNETVDMITET